MNGIFMDNGINIDTSFGDNENNIENGSINTDPSIDSSEEKSPICHVPLPVQKQATNKYHRN
jgi:hypothetical protein